MAEAEEDVPEVKRQRIGDGVDEIVEDNDDDDVDAYEEEAFEVVTSLPEEQNSQVKDPLNMQAFTFEILSLDQVNHKLKLLVSEVHEVIEFVPHSTLRTMLNYVDWEKERLYIRYFGNEEEFMREANAQIGSIPKSVPPEASCEICCETISVQTAFAMTCGHWFCNTCWIRYLSVKIVEQREGPRLTCPGCTVIVENVDVERLIKDAAVISKYNKNVYDNFVDKNRCMRWCTKAGCKLVAWSPNPAWGKVSCECGHAFCFCCGVDWHEPIKCELLKTWMTKIGSDTGNSTWLLKNTKDCPNCGTMIEKNGGCNRLICKKCGQHFCWNCGEKWSNHNADAYQCNRFYDPEHLKSSKITNNRLNIQRFNHFHTRWANHERSLQLEAKLVPVLQMVRTDYEQNHGMTWTEVQFLQEALNVLVNCRKTLMFTYVFAYYLEAQPAAFIFDSNQSNLERETETLSQFLENDLNTNEFTPQQHRARISDKSNYCDSRRRALVQHVYQGYAEESWEFIE